MKWAYGQDVVVIRFQICIFDILNTASIETKVKRITL